MKTNTLRLGMALLAGVAAAAVAGAAAAQSAGYRAVDPENLLLVETTKGKAIIEMRPDVAPLAVARIKQLTRQGYYDDDAFYRVVPGYLAQTGAKAVDAPNKSGLGGIKDEFSFTPATPLGAEGGFAGALALASDGARAHVLFCPGTAGLAHYADADSGDSQIFFTTGRAPVLDKTFTAWGRVVRGLYAFQLAAAGEPPANPDRTKRVRVVADLPEAERPKVYMAEPGSDAFNAAIAHAKAQVGAGYTACTTEVPVEIKMPAPPPPPPTS